MRTKKPSIEHEIALSLDDTCANEALAWLHRLPHTTHLRTTQLLNVYFDTPSQALAQAKAALRLRFDTEAQHWIQTLKTAGRSSNGMSARQEWESVLPQTENAATADIWPQWQFELFAVDAQAILQPLADELIAIFHTDFQRDIFLYDDGQDQFEIALDRGHIRLPEGSEAINPHPTENRIQDLEIELIHGSLEHMQTLAEQIRVALHAAPQTLSKAARGYHLCISST